MDIKLLFALGSAGIGFAGSVPYIRDIFRRRTRPHLYTWLIWSITQGVAAAAAWETGGWGAYNLALGTGMCILVTILSLRYGSKDITRSDTVLLFGALAAIGIWLHLQDPLSALVTATAIDIAGYLPTYRKTWRDPRSETPVSWVSFSLAMVLALLALDTYSALTTTYLGAMAIANGFTALLTLRRYGSAYGRAK